MSSLVARPVAVVAGRAGDAVGEGPAPGAVSRRHSGMADTGWRGEGMAQGGARRRRGGRDGARAGRATCVVCGTLHA